MTHKDKNKAEKTLSDAFNSHKGDLFSISRWDNNVEAMKAAAILQSQSETSTKKES